MMPIYKRALFLFAIAAVFVHASASVFAAESLFEKNLKWGTRDHAAVIQLQQFLTEQGLYTGPITGNYYSQTYKAVIRFQGKYSIVPASGYFGPTTRAKANELNTMALQSISSASVAQSGGETPPATSLFDQIANDASLSLQARIGKLNEHVRSLQTQLSQYKKNKTPVLYPPTGSGGGGSPAPTPTPVPEPASVAPVATTTATTTSPVPPTPGDTTKPTVTLSSVSSTVTNAPFVVSATFSEPVVNFVLADVLVTNGTASVFSGSAAAYTFTVTPAADGVVSVDIPTGVATDAAGNTNSAAPTLSRTYDHTAPVISGLSSDAVSRQSKTWIWSSEASAMFRYLIDTNVNTSPTGSLSSTATASKSGVTGTYYLHVQASDAAGNISPVVTVSVKLDNTAPVLAQVTAVPTPGTNVTPAYTFSSSEAGSVTYAGDCSSTKASATAGNTTVTFAALSVAIHSNCTIRVTDSAGNQSVTLAVASFTITATPPVVQPPQAGEIYLNAYTTAYTYFDNTPPGSADISHPILHQKAGGTGTFADPITIAVGHSIINGQDILDYPAGAKFYIPNVRRYFIVEDTCGDGNTPQNGPCHKGYPAGTTTWLDMWIDGGSGTNATADACAGAVTDANGEVHVAIQNPASNYAVVVGPVILGGVCTQQYGNTAVTQ